MILSLNRASSRPGHHGVARGRHCSACREVGANDQVIRFFNRGGKYSSEGSEQGYNTAQSIISVKEPMYTMVVTVIMNEKAEAMKFDYVMFYACHEY